jgi:hypothetical protein
MRLCHHRGDDIAAENEEGLDGTDGQAIEIRRDDPALYDSPLESFDPSVP